MHHLLLLWPSIGQFQLLIALLNEEPAFEELESFINDAVSSVSFRTFRLCGTNLHNWRTNRHNRIPLMSVKRHNAKQALQKGQVEQRKVKCHR